MEEEDYDNSTPVSILKWVSDSLSHAGTCHESKQGSNGDYEEYRTPDHSHWSVHQHITPSHKQSVTPSLVTMAITDPEITTFIPLYLLKDLIQLLTIN